MEISKKLIDKLYNLIVGDKLEKLNARQDSLEKENKELKAKIDELVELKGKEKSNLDKVMESLFKGIKKDTVDGLTSVKEIANLMKKGGVDINQMKEALKKNGITKEYVDGLNSDIKKEFEPLRKYTERNESKT